MSGALTSCLEAALATLPGRTALCVAFSGGPDSTALLHALAQLPDARARGLRALHVDHGLHANSGTWAQHCAERCRELEVPCQVITVTVATSGGMGTEAAAREARYRAFSSELRNGEYLVLGHHRDDQAETVLLKLLRGAGPEGLGGMRDLRPFGAGHLWRPLLGLSRQQLRDYVIARELDWIDDPSNDDTRLARNHLRRDILPLLKRHWPQAGDSIVHSARLSREAADALRGAWMVSFDAIHDPATGSLDALAWLGLKSALREPLLDHWLHAQGLPAPTTAQRRQIEHQCHARAGQQPCIRWPGAELHIWRERLWATMPAPVTIDDWEHPWQGETLSLPGGGTLSLDPSGARLSEPLRVRWRRGGERIKPVGDAHTRELRDLFQQAGVPPWQRMQVPLIDAGQELVAVADRWVSERGAGMFFQAGARPRWQPARARRDFAAVLQPFPD